MGGIHRKSLAVLLAVVVLAVGLCVIPDFSVSASPDEGGRVPYTFHFETLHTASAYGSIISVLRDMELALDQPIEAVGWLATDEGVSAYQYLWLPMGGSTAEWITVENASIQPRDDLAAAGVGYVSGHATAGFKFSIAPPDGTPEGYYDVYIRALDGMGTPCDLAAILNLRYGEPDPVSDEGQTISIPRIEREGGASLFGGAYIEDGAICLPPDGGIRLGELNLAAFETVKITYTTPEPENVEGERIPILGLKSAGQYSYGKGEEAYNTTHSLAYAPLQEGAGELSMDLSACGHDGEVWLTGHLGGEIRITEIRFVAVGYSGDRVAARINFSKELVSAYFSGYNHTAAKGITDPTMGEVLRLEVQDATGDPFVYFRAGDLLRAHDIALDADEYKYMVFLYRADPANNHDRMNLYLCAGRITAATEECNQGVSLKKDGKWHYLLVDLTQRANWEGIINGWRFDYISAESDPGDGVEFASVQFFRTAEAAQRAASADPAAREPYFAGDPIVIRDMSEEESTSDRDFILNPEDTYEVTEPESDPVTEPETPPQSQTTAPLPDTQAPDSDAIDSIGSEPSTPGRGCASVLTSLTPILLSSAALPLLARRKYLIAKGESHEA